MPHPVERHPIRVITSNTVAAADTVTVASTPANPFNTTLIGSTILTFGGNDQVNGGGGLADVGSGAGADPVHSGGGDDEIEGGPGADSGRPAGERLRVGVRRPSPPRSLRGWRSPALWLAPDPLPISEREREIAMLAGDGHSNRDIARRLRISQRTVENHLYSVFTKLDVSRRSQLKPIFRASSR